MKNNLMINFVIIITICIYSSCLTNTSNNKMGYIKNILKIDNYNIQPEKIIKYLGIPDSQYVDDEFYKEPKVIKTKLLILKYANREYQFITNEDATVYNGIYYAVFTKDIKFINSSYEEIINYFGTPDEKSMDIIQFKTNKNVGYVTYYISYEDKTYYVLQFNFEEKKVIQISYSIMI